MRKFENGLIFVYFVFALLLSKFAFAQNLTDLCWEAGCSSFQNAEKFNVKIGVYVNALSAFSTEASTVRFDFYLWLKWPRCVRDVRGVTINPHKTLEFVNAVTRVDLSVRPSFEFPSCAIFPGEAYFEARVEGNFQQVLDFSKYPLDQHNLVLAFEDVLYGSNQLAFIQDVVPGQSSPTSSGIKGGTRLSGWTINGLTEVSSDRRYASSNFERAYTNTAFNNYRFAVNISRGAVVYAFKVLPPILITLVISLLILLLDPESMDTRIATAVGGLLAEIFLQLSFSSYLPQATDYLTVMDWVFNITWIFIFLVIVESIIIRKKYYQLLLEDDLLDDEIDLASLNKDSSKTTSPNGSFVNVNSNATNNPVVVVPGNNLPDNTYNNNNNLQASSSGNVVTVTNTASNNSTKVKHSSSFLHSSIDQEELVEKKQKVRIKKEKVKRRVRNIEKILFAIALSVYGLAIFITSIAGGFSPNPEI